MPPLNPPPRYLVYQDADGTYGVMLAGTDRNPLRIPGFTRNFRRAEELALLFTSCRLSPVHLMEAAENYRDVFFDSKEMDTTPGKQT